MVSPTGTVHSTSSVIRVPADYSTIQAAVNAASPGDVVIVGAGVYHENLIVNESVTIIGIDERMTVIEGKNNGIAVSVSADNVLISGFTVRNGTGGIRLTDCSNVTVSGNIITMNWNYGLALKNSHNIAIIGNIIPRVIPTQGVVAGDGIGITSSTSCVLSDNNIANVISGISVYNSSENVIARNMITAAEIFDIGVVLCNYTEIHHNAFMQFLNSAVYHEYSNVSWSDGSEGNYWGDYAGLDDGSNGRVAGDGVGDTALPHNGVDEYPLVRPPFPVPFVWGDYAYPVAMDSNSTISTFRFTQPAKQLSFNVTGPVATMGFCNVTIPKSLLIGNPWAILLNGSDITSAAQISENETHSFIRLAYDHSSHSIQIIGTSVVPEFPAGSMTILTLLSATSLTALVVRRRRIKKTIRQ
jgi:parallel beta-helix repeat protein